MDSADQARTVIAVDLDNDGDNDAVSASVGDDTIAWYRNDGNGYFSTHIVDAETDGVYMLYVKDADRDGDLDLFASGRDSNEITLHRQQYQTHSALLAQGGGLVINAARLLTIDADDGPDDLTYTLTAPPGFGALQRGGIPLPVGATFSQSDLNNNLIRYVHGGLSLVSDSFSFKVADGGEDGTQPAAGTFALSVIEPADVLVELPFDEGSGTVAVDVGGMGRNGLLVNGPVYEANTADGSAFALHFDEVNDYIDLGSLDVTGSGLTLAVWFNADSFPGASADPWLISKSSIFMLRTAARGRRSGCVEVCVQPGGRRH
jgi:Cadherin-like/FG-GAP-like repeat